MSNRRTKQTRTRRPQAPRDHAAVLLGSEEKTPRGLLHWVLLASKVTVGLALISVAVGALSWGVYRYAQTTPRFAVVEIELEGTRRLRQEDVLGAAALRKGQNLFSIDTARAEGALRESPWIASARVSRQLPGTVRVSIREREARAIAVISGKNYLVAEDGLPFKELGQGDPHDLPLITGVSAQAIKKDRRAELARLTETLGLLRDFEKLSFSQKHPVEEVHLDPSGRASLVVGQGGITLHLGTAPWKKKLLRAERVLSKAEREGGTPSVAFFDNEAHPERVVLRVR
jgi:cell division protein FtsQ